MASVRNFPTPASHSSSHLAPSLPLKNLHSSATYMEYCVGDKTADHDHFSCPRLTFGSRFPRTCSHGIADSNTTTSPSNIPALQRSCTQQPLYPARCRSSGRGIAPALPWPSNEPSCDAPSAPEQWQSCFWGLSGVEHVLASSSPGRCLSSS